MSILRLNHRQLDLSSSQLDGSHTPVKNGWAAVGYQGRKGARTTNTLFLADNTGQFLAVATLQAGNHHDTFAREHVFTGLCTLLEQARLRLDGLLLNTDRAFDVSCLRQACAVRDIDANIPRNLRTADWQTDDDTPLNSKLYRRRLVIEQINAWLDGFKTLSVYYETCLENGLAFHWFAFVILSSA